MTTHNDKAAQANRELVETIDAVPPDPGQAMVEYHSQLLADNPDLFTKLAAVLTGVPTTEDDGAAAIVLALLEAKTAEDYNAVFDADSFRKRQGEQVRVLGVKRAVSDFTDGLGLFLIAEVVDPKTGEKSTWTSGAVAVVATLASMQYKGQLPADVVPYERERPTKKGYHPLQLRVVRLNAVGA